MVVSNERKTRRVLSHARTLASTMKTGERKFVPRQQINGGKVMVEKTENDKFNVYALSNKRFIGARGKKNYAISVFKGSNAGFTSGGVYHRNTYTGKKLRSKLLTFKNGKKSYKEGSTGSKGG